MPIPPFLPPQLPWLFDVLVGQEWPQADEDACRRCAQAWSEALGALVALADGGNSAAKTVGYSVQSVSSDEFDRYWSKYTQGDRSAVGQMAQQCQALAEMLLQEAEQVEAAKLSIDIQIVILAIQLIVDIATAVVTAGASMAEGGVATLAARFTIKKLLMELLKGALLAAAPDFITQSIMLAEGHQGSYDIGRTLTAAGTGALGAGVGMGVGAITGGLAASLSKRVVGDVADTMGKKVAGLAVDAGNAAVTGALSNMATTALTDAVTGQSLDNVWSAGLTGGAGGLLFHAAHEVGTTIGEHNRPAPVDFTTSDGKALHGLPLKDGSFALFDEKGIKHGTGTFDAESGQLSVRPVDGAGYQTTAKVEPGGGGGQHGGPGPGPSPEPLHGGAGPTAHGIASLAGAGPLETRNSMLDAIQAAANPVAESFSSLGEQPVQRSDFVSWPDPTPEIGAWTERDAAWLNVSNDPENLGKGLSSEEIARRWQAGEDPPGVVTREALVNGENKYLDSLADPGRKAFHELARQELEQRHDAVKSVLDDVRNKLGAGKFRGEDHYRKFAKSLDRKLDEIPGLSFEEFAKSGAGPDQARAKLNGLALEVNDALRYTMVFDENDYARGAHETLKALQAAGCRLLDEQKLPDGTKVPGVRPLLEDGKLPDGAKFAKNFWREGNRYLGINLTLVDEHGGPFELQFHTPRSFDVKQYLSHVPYEVYRLSDMPPERRVNAMLELVSMSDKYLSGHVPEGLEDFAPTRKDNGLDKLFSDLRGEYEAGRETADTPEKLYRADKRLWDLEDQQRAIQAANRELAEHLNALTQGGRTPEEIHRLFGQTVDLLRAREQLTTNPAEWRRLQYETSRYEPPQHEPASGEHTALGPPPGDLPAGHGPALHLDHPIHLTPDHLVFPFRDEAGHQLWAHMQQVGDRWVLHGGGPEGEELTAMGANLRTTPPGLDLIGHATPEGFLIGGKTVPFEDVLAHIPGAPGDTGPIRLIACEAGGVPGAPGEAAQRLADLSGRKVIAADSTVWVSPDGHVVASNPVDRATNWYPKIPPDGVWHEFEPGVKTEDGYHHTQAQEILAGDPRLPHSPDAWLAAASPADQPMTALSGDEAVRAKIVEQLNVRGADDKAPPANDRFEAAVDEHIVKALFGEPNPSQEDRLTIVRGHPNPEAEKIAAIRRGPGLPGHSSGNPRELSRSNIAEIAARAGSGLLDVLLGHGVTVDANGKLQITKPDGKGGFETVEPDPNVRRSEFVKIGGITVELTIPLIPDLHPANVKVEFPNRRHTYEAIGTVLTGFRVSLEATNHPHPDQELASAIKDLLCEDPKASPEDLSRKLHMLAHDTAPTAFGPADRATLATSAKYSDQQIDEMRGERAFSPEEIEVLRRRTTSLSDAEIADATAASTFSAEQIAELQGSPAPTAEIEALRKLGGMVQDLGLKGNQIAAAVKALKLSDDNLAKVFGAGSLKHGSALADEVGLPVTHLKVLARSSITADDFIRARAESQLSSSEADVLAQPHRQAFGLIDQITRTRTHDVVAELAGVPKYSSEVIEILRRVPPLSDTDADALRASPKYSAHDVELLKRAPRFTGGDIAAVAAAANFTPDQVVKFGGALAELVGHVEPARDPRALVNLANLDVAANGDMSLVDAVRRLNPASPKDGARYAPETHDIVTSNTVSAQHGEILTKEEFAKRGGDQLAGPWSVNPDLRLHGSWSPAGRDDFEVTKRALVHVDHTGFVAVDEDEKRQFRSEQQAYDSELQKEREKFTAKILKAEERGAGVIEAVLGKGGREVPAGMAPQKVLEDMSDAEYKQFRRELDYGIIRDRDATRAQAVVREAMAYFISQEYVHITGESAEPGSPEFEELLKDPATMEKLVARIFAKYQQLSGATTTATTTATSGTADAS